MGQRLTVRCVSVLVCDCAIPVVWKVLPYNQEGSWQPDWQGLLAQRDGVIPADWRVLVLADRGLYAPWLYRQIVAQGWHPFLRINLAATACGGAAGETAQTQTGSSQGQRQKGRLKNLPV